MNPGDLLVRATIWPAVGLGLAACLGRREGSLWRWGLAFYLVHAAAAFHWVHHWSHEAAWQHTARQVRDVVGWESGAGVWVNYGFTLAWVAVVAAGPRLPPTLARAWRALFVFIAFQGAVVFAPGPARWIALLGFGLAGWVGLARRRSRRGTPAPGAGPGRGAARPG